MNEIQNKALMHLRLCVVIAVCLSVCSCTVIDLTHIYDKDVLYPPVGPNGSADLFNFTVMHKGYNADLDAWLEINWYGVFEHGSTHIDAPAHYVQGRAHLEALDVEQFMGPGVMINVQDKTATHRDYVVTIDDIKAWEREHGEIPQESIVMLNTGKHKVYPNRKLFYDTEFPLDSTTYHNAGLDPAAAVWLMHNRQIKDSGVFNDGSYTLKQAACTRFVLKSLDILHDSTTYNYHNARDDPAAAVLLMHKWQIKAFGTDAHSCDIGQNNNRNPCHEEFLPNGVLLLEFVANLDRMPPTGSRIIYAPMKMRGGSGGPTRILCIFGDGGEAASGSDSVLKPFTGVTLLFIFSSSFIFAFLNLF